MDAKARKEVHQLQGTAAKSGRDVDAVPRPPVALLLEADYQHRRKVRKDAFYTHAGDLTSFITRFEWCTPQGKWRFKTRYEGEAECVAIYYRAPDGDRRPRRRFVLTAQKGSLRGKRIVRGRIDECRELYRLGPPPSKPVPRRANPYLVMLTVIALLLLPFIYNYLNLNDNEGWTMVANDREPRQENQQAVTKPGLTEPRLVTEMPERLDESELVEPFTAGRPRLDDKTPNAVAAVQSDPRSDDIGTGTHRRSNIQSDTGRHAVQVRGTGRRAPTDAFSVEIDEVAAVAPPSDIALAGKYRSSSEQPRSGTAFSIETAFDEYRKSNPGLRFDPARPDSYWEMNLRSSFASSLRLNGRIAFSSFDSASRDGFADDHYRGMRLGLQGLAGGFRYGTHYRSAGKNFSPRKKDKNKLKRDREIWETWTARRFSDIEFRAALVQERNNLHGNPEKPRLRDREARMTFSHQLSNWPSYGYALSYGTGSRESFDEPAGYAAFRGPMERFGASLYFASNHWNASLNSYQIAVQESHLGGRGSRIRGHSLSASYYPSASFSISPWLRVSDEYYEVDESRTRGESLGLSIGQSFPRKRLRFDAYASYYNERNPSWNLDTEGMYAETSLVWALNRRGHKPQSMGLHFTYNRYHDHIFPESSTEEMALWLIYKTSDGLLPFASADEFSSLR